MNVLGLSGYAGAGKTTAANYLEREYGFTRRHIATPLRAMLKELLRANGLDDQTIWAYLEGPLKEDLIPELGRTGRYLQIKLGTEFGREMIGTDVWVDTWERSVKPGDNPMNDSVRFPNEERKIRDMGGFTILIDRPGKGPASFKSGLGKVLYERFGWMRGVHDSERIDRLTPDVRLVNGGCITALHHKIDDVMKARGIARVGADSRRIAA